MIKKDSIKKLVEEVIHSKVKNQLELKGFKYVKSKGLFSKNVKKFKQIISISSYGASIVFNESKDLIQLNFSITSSIQVPRFENWCEKEYGEKHIIHHYLNSFKYQYDLSNSELSILESYTPTKSQQFKSNVSKAIAGHTEYNYINFNEIEQHGFFLFESNLNLFCNPKKLYDNRKNGSDLTYIRMLEYFGKIELAKRENISSINLWKERIEKTEFKSVSERNIALMYYNKRIDIINQRFSTQLNQWNEIFLPFEIETKTNKILVSNSTSLNLVVSIKNPSSKIIYYYSIDNNLFQIREDGSIIKHRRNGEVIDRIKLEHFDKLNNLSINYSRNGTILYVANLVIKSNEITLLNINSKLKNKDSKIPIPFSQVFLKKEQCYAFLITNYRKHEIHFCDKNGIYRKHIELTERPIEIIPELNIILCVKEDKSCQVYDLEGNFKYSMPSNNARYNFKDKYDYNLKADMFLSGWYYSKSQLYNLSKGELVKNIWAHPTHIKKYKETLYSDINHNFGMDRFKFSPQGNYIVGGADHGKYVAWNTDKVNRVELIPSEKYLSRLKNVQIVELKGQRFLKNRNNLMGEIIFIDNGNKFGFQINKDLLIWNRDFKHIDTILDIGYIKQINENLLMVVNEGIYSLYEINLL